MIPPLITTEGLVLNNQMPDSGALGGYTPPGTASSEGVSILMRGIMRAAAATQDPAMLAYGKFLYEGAINGFFKGVRPEDADDNGWHHSWICNGGAVFNARGPLQASGDLALSGYIYGRDPEAAVTFTNGVGQLTPPAAIVYQAVSEDAKFVWKNVFADLTEGSRVEIDYYIDAGGNKVFGAQRGGSFGQPAIPAGKHDDGEPGKIQLKTAINGVIGVSYCVSIPDVAIGYGELYEAWPMWRKLADQEVSTAADGIHWFIDAFKLGVDLEPTNPMWAVAYDEMMKVFVTTCGQESNTTRIFQASPLGPHNNFPLTYSYAYGRENIDDPSTNWDAVSPSTKYYASRTPDGYVTFDLPSENAVISTGEAVRYGLVFENKPLYLTYDTGSSVSFDVKSSVEQVVSVTIQSEAGLSYSTNLHIGPASDVQEISISQFKQFQQIPGDSLGEKSGVWIDGPAEWVVPAYAAVPFPGRRGADVGDSITHLNTAYIPKQPGPNRYEVYGNGYAGWWVIAEQILGHRTVLEHGIQPNLTGANSGTSFAVASSKVATWWEEAQFLGSNTFETMGPMYGALNNLSSFDICYMLGGTNDLSANDPAPLILSNIKRAATDIAKNGKWVFLGTILPRTRFYLAGYPLEQQATILTRLQEINQGIRDWINIDQPPNIFLVDFWDSFVGPNGIDPAGHISNLVDPLGADTVGNFRPDAPGLLYTNDGLHPTAAGAYAMGKVLAAAMIAAGVPAREEGKLGPLTLGPNLVTNPTFAFTQFDTATNSASWAMSDIGWATGLGPQVKVGTLHNGYQFGKVPDNWKFWRCSNAEDIPIGMGVGGTYSNFMSYIFSDLVGEFPNMAAYMQDSNWAPGGVTVTPIVHEGTPSLRIVVNMPVTGHKNQGFILVAQMPKRQHGVWDNYGYNGPDANLPNPLAVPNTIISPGDRLSAECDVIVSGMNNTCFAMHQTLACYQNQIGVSYGTKVTSYGNQPFFWPPSDMDYCRLPTEDRVIKMHSPALVVPTPLPSENAHYWELHYEFSFDASQIGPQATIIIKNPSVRKIIGGSLT
jgi:lysophospholipase L1-like esterase